MAAMQNATQVRVSPLHKNQDPLEVKFQALEYQTMTTHVACVVIAIATDH